MGGWIMDVLGSIATALFQASGWELAFVFSILTVIGPLVLTLVHEFGHAIAVRLRRLPLESLVVGDTDNVIVRAGGVIMRLGLTRQDEGFAGFVCYDPARASARDIIVIALAGPTANLVVAPVFAGLALIGGTNGTLDACLWLLSAGSVATAVANLVPRGTPGTSDLLNDGRIIRLAWAWRHMPVTDWPELDAEPPAPSAAPEPPSEWGSGLRWPFAVALGLVAALAFATGGAALVAALVVVFGAAFLQGAHRHKIR